MRRYAQISNKTFRRLRYELRRAIQKDAHSLHNGQAQRIGFLAGKLFRAREERAESMPHPASPRLRAIQDRIARRDASNAENDRFWLTKYLEGFVLVPKGEFDPEKHPGINYVIP